MPNMSLKKVPMPEQEPNVRNHNFQEVSLGYTKEMAMEEAARCLNCKHKPCVGLDALATIQQPTIEMGRRAADTLIRAIVGKPIETKNIHLQPKLVVRGSVKTIYGERILYV